MHRYEKGSARRAGPALTASAALLLAATHAAADSPLNFSVTPDPGLAAMQAGTPAEQALAAEVLDGFHAAADVWRAFFFDNVTVNLTLEFGEVPPGAGGTALPEFIGVAYAETLYPAMTADAVGPADTLAVANLPAPLPTGVPFVTNDTTVVPSPRTLDDDGSINNTFFTLTRPQAKALGLLPAQDAALDGLITINELVPFDFDPGDGIDADKIDYNRLAAHEIGHALGFFSGVDTVDVVGGDGVAPESPIVDQHIDLDPLSVYTPIDLFRYTAQSAALGGINDGAFDQPAPDDRPFFSLDDGATALATFSTGQFNGDGRQASHWEDDLWLGILDPSLAFGELLPIRPPDVWALDVIGWDREPVPEPGALVLLGTGVVCGVARRRSQEGA